MNNMQIIDNFLPQDKWETIHRVLTGDAFPWYLNKDSAYTGDGYINMTHKYYQDNRVTSDWYGMLKPVIEEFEKQTQLQIKNILRIKSNLVFNRTITKEEQAKQIHQDVEDPNYVSLLYYVHDSDGDTILYQDDKETEVIRIKPVANRASIFDSRIWHTGTLPTINQSRQGINFIFEVK